MLNKEKIFKIMNIKNIASLHDLSERVDMPYTTVHYIINNGDTKLSTAKRFASNINENLTEIIDSDTFFLYTERDGVLYERKVKASNLYEVTAKYML